MEGGIPQGTQIGSYVVESFLGRGGMGVVYKAYHPRLDRWSAIKLLPPFQTSNDARERFEREARAVARLRHRHILSVFDFGEFAGQPYMVVEYMPNGSLSERMPKAPLTVPQALSLLRPLGEALDHAHTQGVLHRDVKPANVFLDSELQPVLADFGLAKMTGEESLTASGMIAGTPTHISPEQALGKPLDAKSDLYSLAVIGYQLLAGRLPFQGEGMMDLLYAHVHADVPAATSFNPALPPAVDVVFARALAKDRAERFASAAEMMGALEAAGANRVDERRPQVPVAATVAAAAATAERRTQPAVAAPIAEVETRRPSPPQPRARSPWTWVATFAVLLVAAGIGYWLFTRPGAAIPTLLTGRSASPSPAASAGATGAPRFVTVAPPSPLRLGSTITVSGKGLDPSRNANAGILAGGVVHPISGGIQVKPDGSFTVDGVVPSDLSPGAAAVIACNLDSQNRSDLSQCIQLNVTLTR
jgi:eukaryotic-like serine/threonine-protein kinase